MSEPPSQFTPRALAPACCAILAGAVGLAALLAWGAGVYREADLSRAHFRMMPATASVIVCLAAALWLRRREGLGRGWPSRGLLAWAGGLSAFNAAWRIMGPGAGAETPSEGAAVWEMSLLAGLGGAAVTAAVAGMDYRSATGRRPLHAFAVVAALVALVDGLGDIYADVTVLQFGWPGGMAPISAATLVCLAVGVLFSRKGPGALQILASEGPGGVIARRLLPVVVFAPPALDVARDWLAGDGAAGRAAQTALMVLMLGALVWRVAARADAVEEKRRELAESLAESERRAREMVESLPHLVWTCTAEGRCDYLSPQWARYAGAAPAGDLGEEWLKRVHPGDRDEVMGRWREAIASGAGLDAELRLRRHDGVYRWFKTRAEPMRGADGRVRKWFGTSTDIDDQRRAEEALRATRDNLERLVLERTAELELASSRMRVATGAAALGVWDWEVESGTLTWDEPMFRIYGWPGRGASEKIDFTHWSAAVLPEDLPEARAAAERALREEGEFDHVFRIRRPDGRVRHVHGRATVLRDAAGRPIRMVGVNRDVTEEREAELRLRASEARLSEFVRHVPAAIAMLDRDLRYLGASERWRSDYRLGDGELAGRSHYEVFPDLPPRWHETHRRVLAGAVERADEEEFVLRDGRVEWLQWEARPWRREDGVIGGILISSLPITARKRMEMDLERQKRELERSNRDLEQFAFVASHDLQEPLRAVAGCVQLLQRRHGDKLEPGARELIAHSVDGARRMQALILDLLTYSRVGTGGMAIERVSLAEPLGAALGNLAAAIEEAGAVVTRDPLWPEAPVDRARVTMLFQNLLGNALKYRAPGRPPRIHVGVEASPGGPVVVVRDNGIGIEPRFFDRIFVIFQRLHTRDEYPGTGVGLALCQKIVERHGGRIWVESTPGEGSVFRFTLASLRSP